MATILGTENREDGETKSSMYFYKVRLLTNENATEISFIVVFKYNFTLNYPCKIIDISPCVQSQSMLALQHFILSAKTCLFTSVFLNRWSAA
jgi:hypothetical protein